MTPQDSIITMARVLTAATLCVLLGCASIGEYRVNGPENGDTDVVVEHPVVLIILRAYAEMLNDYLTVLSSWRSVTRGCLFCCVGIRFARAELAKPLPPLSLVSNATIASWSSRSPWGNRYDSDKARRKPRLEPIPL